MSDAHSSIALCFFVNNDLTQLMNLRSLDGFTYGTYGQKIMPGLLIILPLYPH